jgi:DNA-binding NarL/FixJ family response regulator
VYTVLLVEDHPLITEGMIKIIESSTNLSLAGVARNTKECLDLLEQCKPDIILLDVLLSGINGNELCRIISARGDKPKILAHSTFYHRYYIDSMLSNGADGYLLKTTTTAEIVKAIETVLKGETYLPGDMADVTRQEPENPACLSPREIEVLKLIGEGFTNREIAGKLFISPLTVDSHRKNLILKMGVRNTASLIKIASMNGII